MPSQSAAQKVYMAGISLGNQPVIGNHCFWHLQIKGGPLLQKQLVHNATIANLVPRWQNFGATQFELQVMYSFYNC